MGTRKEVVQLYKNMLYMGRDYPAGFEYFRDKLRTVFRRNVQVTDPEVIRKHIAHGEFVCKELEALYMLRKYRTLKRRYYDHDSEAQRVANIEKLANT